MRRLPCVFICFLVSVVLLARLSALVWLWLWSGFYLSGFCMFFVGFALNCTICHHEATFIHKGVVYAGRHHGKATSDRGTNLGTGQCQSR